MSEAVTPKALRWDGTVTAGNVLTAGTLLVTLLVWGMRLEGRVDRTEERQATYEAVARQYRAEDRANELAAFNEVRGSLRRIENFLLEQGRDNRRGGQP